MFKVTPQAAEQVRAAAEQGGTAGMALRLAAQQRPDGSIDYRMGFDEATEDDIRFDSEGVLIVMAPEFVPLLDTATLDFVELEKGDAQFGELISACPLSAGDIADGTFFPGHPASQRAAGQPAPGDSDQRIDDDGVRPV